jgi:hypothetical protein
MSDENEIRDACNVIIEKGNLTKKENIFLTNCINSTNPTLFLEKNINNPVFNSIFKKLSEIFQEIEK